jgi:hypothetical protein
MLKAGRDMRETERFAGSTPHRVGRVWRSTLLGTGRGVAGDTVPDEVELRQRAQTRLRRRSVLLLVVMLASVVAGAAIGGYRAGRPTHSPLSLVVAAGGVLLVFAAFYSVLFLVLGRPVIRDPALVVGADRTTRKAVERALATGHADDPRVAALTGDTARRVLRQRILLWLWPASLMLLVAGTALQLTDRDRNWWAIGSETVALAVTVAVWCWFLVRRRRSRRYLDHP